MASNKRRHSVQHSPSPARSQKSKRTTPSAGVSSLSAGTLGIGFIALMIIGLIAGAVIAPQIFGRDKVGATTESKPEVLGPDLYSDTAASLTSATLQQTDNETTSQLPAERVDWSVAPTPSTTPQDSIDSDARIEQSKARAYALIGQSESIPYIHAAFFPFTELAVDRYYSALVDLTFVVDTSRNVVSEICTGRASAPSTSSNCATNPIEPNP